KEGNNKLYESVDGGRSWTKLGNPKPQGRVPFLATNLREGGGEQWFDLWFGDVGLWRIEGQARTSRQPGGASRLDPMNTWYLSSTGASDDAGGIAFDLSIPNAANKLPVVYANDSGTFVYQPNTLVTPFSIRVPNHGYNTGTKVGFDELGGAPAIPGLANHTVY